MGPSDERNRGGRTQGWCLGVGAQLFTGNNTKFSVGGFILGVNHQMGPHPSEIPLRLLLLKLLEICLVCCKEPHFHVGTDGAKLSLTETDNSKTEI